MPCQKSSDPDQASNSEPTETDHLQDLADGAGCTEIWEHLSEGRSSESDEDGCA